MKETLLLVEDKKSEAQFCILESSAELALAKLQSLELDLSDFTVTNFQDGSIFEMFKKQLIVDNETKEVSPNELLHRMINACRIDGDCEDTHAEADKQLCVALGNKYSLAAQVFSNMEKWYA